MKLKSDFLDYYDHHFDLDGEEFRRVTTEGPDRVEVFKKIFPLIDVEAASFFILTHHTSKYLGPSMVVVYLDTMAHRGEQKCLLSAEDAYDQYPGNWATLFYPSGTFIYAHSQRHLQIGDKWFRLLYKSHRI